MARNTWTRRQFIANTGSAGASILLGAKLLGCSGVPSNSGTCNGNTAGGAGTNPCPGTGGTGAGGTGTGGTSTKPGTGGTGTGGTGTNPGTVSMVGKVVHVHDATATNWDFGTSWYGSHVDATVVQKIFNRAIMELTGTTTTAAAWAVLLPKYAAGQKFAIKVNFNNYTGTDPDKNIDALIEPVNAVIQTLLDFGVPGANISVYDVTNGLHDGRMPQAPFIARCINPDVKFVCHYGNSQAFSTTETATFPASMNITPRPIAQCLVAADYLINLPIMKTHYMGATNTGLSVTSLGLKHHFGSIDKNDGLHNTCTPASNPNAQVELFKNKHISGKTVLTVVDMLFGSWAGVSEVPKPWQLYGNKAGNALVVAKDPIAIDCVLTDILAAEVALHSTYTPLPANTWNPLQTAATAGLGTFEKGDPMKTPIGSGYSTIKYVYIDGVA